MVRAQVLAHPHELDRSTADLARHSRVAHVGVPVAHRLHEVSHGEGRI